MTRNIPTHKVRIYQAGKEAVFTLNDREYNSLQHTIRRNGVCCLYNFEMHTFADYGMTPSKAKRFNSIFNYHNGDFHVRDVEKT